MCNAQKVFQSVIFALESCQEITLSLSLPRSTMIHVAILLDKSVVNSVHTFTIHFKIHNYSVKYHRRQ